MADIFNKAVAIAATLNIPEECVGDGVYLGNANRYLIVTMTASPTFYADDEPNADRYIVDLDVYVPLSENYRAWEASLRHEMEAAGFTEVTFEGQIYDTDSNKRHLMFNGIYDNYREDPEEED